MNSTPSPSSSPSNANSPRIATPGTWKKERSDAIRQALRHVSPIGQRRGASRAPILTGLRLAGMDHLHDRRARSRVALRQKNNRMPRPSAIFEGPDGVPVRKARIRPTLQLKRRRRPKKQAPMPQADSAKRCRPRIDRSLADARLSRRVWRRRHQRARYARSRVHRAVRNAPKGVDAALPFRNHRCIALRFMHPTY